MNGRRQYGLDTHRFGPAPSPLDVVRRRVDGRYPRDPFGLDPQLCDIAAPLVTPFVRTHVDGGERIPREGPAVLVANRGVGLGEPLALTVAVQQLTGRRLRFVTGPDLGMLTALSRRLGAVSAHPADLSALLHAGHLVAVPLAPTWLRAEAGRPPLPLCAAMLGFTVYPVAVTPGGPFGLALRPWSIRVGAHIALDGSYPVRDPLGAAELGDAARDAVQAMLTGGDPSSTPQRADLAS
jgi:hypothetical protein